MQVKRTTLMNDDSSVSSLLYEISAKCTVGMELLLSYVYILYFQATASDDGAVDIDAMLGGGEVDIDDAIGGYNDSADDSFQFSTTESFKRNNNRLEEDGGGEVEL